MKVNILRKLARSPKCQILYNNAKEIGGMRFFKNEYDFSGLQLAFLYWVSVYNSLYSDIAMNKKYINNAIIEDEIRTDAYLLWRQEEHKKQTKKMNKPDNIPADDVPNGRVVFIEKPKGK